MKMTRRLARKNIRTGLIVSGICMFMFGVTFIELTVVGVIMTVVCIWRWVGDTRREIEELPLD